jgi:hypothetical protein
VFHIFNPVGIALTAFLVNIGKKQTFWEKFVYARTDFFAQKDITFLKYDFIYTKRSVSVFLSLRIKEKNIFVSKNNGLTTLKKSSAFQK